MNTYFLLDNVKKDGKDTDKNIAIMYYLFETMIGEILATKEQKADKSTNVVPYPHIPFPNRLFCKNLEIAINYLSDKVPVRKIRFIDVGCGLGTKLSLAALMGINDVTGIDINKKYLKIARKLLKEVSVSNMHNWKSTKKFQPLKFKAILADATTFNYNKFDIIYWYDPIFAGTGKIEDRIVATAKPGTVLIQAEKGKANFANYPDEFQHIDECVLVKL